MGRSALLFALVLLGGSASADDQRVPAKVMPQEVLECAAPRLAPAPVVAEYCCKVCRKGKACGDSCIARDKTCRVGPGCACDG